MSTIKGTSPLLGSVECHGKKVACWFVSSLIALAGLKLLLSALGKKLSLICLLLQLCSQTVFQREVHKLSVKELEERGKIHKKAQFQVLCFCKVKLIYSELTWKFWKKSSNFFCSYILRRPQKFEKKITPTFFEPNKMAEFFKFLWPSQNIWTFSI